MSVGTAIEIFQSQAPKHKKHQFSEFSEESQRKRKKDESFSVFLCTKNSELVD
jgi:hypothetical protein